MYLEGDVIRIICDNHSAHKSKEVQNYLATKPEEMCIRDRSTVEQILRFGTADISAPYLACISSIARQYVAELFSTLRKYEYTPDLMRLYVVGGGGFLIRNFGTYDKSRVTIIDDILSLIHI